MKNHKRKLVAVGDLHGDFYRLVRILSEQSILNPDTLEWKPEAGTSDVVLLGDYVDWRGEPLEGPFSEWPYGAKKVLDLLFKLSKAIELLRKKKDFHGNFFPLLGNHDEMMLQGCSIMKNLCLAKNQSVDGFPDAESWVQSFSKMRLPADEEQSLMRFLNWYEQGGNKTIQSFGGLRPWLDAMDGSLGDFMRQLPLGVVVNQKLFCHSVPDDKNYWVPIHRIPNPDEKTREQFLWGRKVWGYDAFMGAPTRPLTEGQVDEMLEQFGVKGVVVGHTPLRKSEPHYHFGGKVINLDTHGKPGSRALVEEYSLQRKRKRHKRQKLQKAP